MIEVPKLHHCFKGKNAYHLVVILLMLFSFRNVDAQIDSLHFLLKKGQMESPVNMRELVYVQTDKSAYLPGDTVYVAAYIINRITRKLHSQASTLWGVILDKDNKPVLTERLLIVNGRARGQFVFPPDMELGIYQLTAFTNWQKNIGQEGVFTTRLEVKELKTPTIRWGIEDLKKMYFPGDTVSFTTTVTNAAYEPIEKQRIQATLGEEKIKVESNEQGKADITFVLPDSLHQKVNIDFTGSMAAFRGASYKEETFSLPVPIKAKKADIQFMPESGYLVAGIPCKVAFKAVDSEGNPIEINGVIEDGAGNMITVAQTMHDGMGYVNMIPEKGKSYSFRSFNLLYDFENVQFPKVQDSGVSLRYNMTENDIVKLQLLHNYPTDFQGTINVNQSGRSYNIVSGAFSKGTIIEVPIADLPAGIVRVTLFDDNQVPLAERLVFVNAHKKLKINDWQNHRFLKTRNQSELHLSFTDSEGNPVKTQLSVSVSDSAYGSSEYVKETSIYASMLLNSELKGNIHNPDFYFEGERKESYLDLLMITHGWRRFVWYETLRKNEALIQEMLNHDLVVGKVMKREEPVLDAEVTFLSLSTVESQTVKVNKEGKFWFKPEYASYIMPDLMLKAQSKQFKERVQLILEPNDSLKNTQMYAIGLEGLEWQSIQVQLDKAKQSISQESDYQLGDIRLLDMLNVQADDQSEFDGSLKDFFAASRAYYRTYKDLYFVPDLSSTIQQIAPDLLVDFISGRAFFPRRGGIPAGPFDDPFRGPGVLLIVDDINQGKIITLFDYLTPDDILDIIIINGSEGFYMYGEEAGEGVIIIRTRASTSAGNFKSIYDKQNMAVLPTYCFDREFYLPVYDTPEKKADPVPDLRTTLYWDNNLETNENGEVEIKWYNGDLRGTKIIKIQAVGGNGELGSFTRSYYLR